MKKIDIDGLLALNLEEIEIVYRRCRGDSVQKVATDLNVHPSTIWNQRMKEILKTLGAEKWREVEEELCIPLRKIIPSLEALRAGWPENFREKIEALKEPIKPPSQAPATTEASSVPSESRPENLTQAPTELASATSTPSGRSQNQVSPGETTEEPAKPRFPLWPVIAVPLLVVCLLCVAAGIFIWQNPPLRQPTQTLAPQAPVSTATTQATSIVASSATASQTPNPTDTAFPTETPVPSDTATASLVPTQPFAFFDDFENGLNPAWTKEYGDPVVTGGQLAASESTLLSVGDTAWTNYKVEFDVKMGNYTCQDQDSSTLGVRASDVDNMLLLRFHPCEIEWSSVINGNRKVIPNTYLGNQGFTDTFVHFIVTVEGNKISLHEKSNLLNSFIDNDHPSGKVYLHVRTLTVFDNFKVTLLNQ